MPELSQIQKLASEIQNLANEIHHCTDRKHKECLLKAMSEVSSRMKNLAISEL